MFKKLSIQVKNYILLSDTCKFILKKLMPLFYFKNLLCDPLALKKDKYWYKKVKSTQIRKKISLFKDRLFEVKEFFNISHIGLIKYYLKKGGFPNTQKARQVIINFFENKTKNNTNLKEAYKDSSFHYSLRLMLGYERYRFILPYMDFIIKNSKKSIKSFKVLDYGCGLADMSLLFASLGAKVTLVDLDDKKFDFAIWRFKKRGFNPTIIKIKNIEEYAKLPKLEYDLIFATEVFEHVRNPLILLKKLTSALNIKGYLIDSMGGNFERELGGDHLKEALQIGNSKKYKSYYNKHYSQLRIKKNLNCLFRRIK